MAKEFKNLNDLYKYINKQAQSSLKTEVAEIAVKTMQDNVQTKVYNVYEPKEYIRTGRLKREIDVGIVDDNTIYIENVRTDKYENAWGIQFEKNVAEVVETGIGYEYPFPYMGVPRPFTQKTRGDLRNGKINKAMKEGLRKRGIDVE